MGRVEGGVESDCFCADEMVTAMILFNRTEVHESTC